MRMSGNEIETSQVFALRDGLDGLHIGCKLAIRFELGEHAGFSHSRHIGRSICAQDLGLVRGWVSCNGGTVVESVDGVDLSSRAVGLYTTPHLSVADGRIEIISRKAVSRECLALGQLNSTLLVQRPALFVVGQAAREGRRSDRARREKEAPENTLIHSALNVIKFKQASTFQTFAASPPASAPACLAAGD